MGSSTPAPTYHAALNVFYDENGNGLHDPNEVGVVPNVSVSLGGKTGVSVPASGYVEMDGVPGGDDAVTLGTMPPFYQAGTAVTLGVPQAAGVPFYVPMVLPIGTNTPALYMAFGDSITDGDNSTDNMGYRSILQLSLIANLNQGAINNQGIGGTRSLEGAQRIADDLAVVNPAYVLIMYGTNDWNDIECVTQFPCYTINSLQTMIEAAKAHHTLPIISSILPCNTGYDYRTPPERNQWVADMNALIKPMALQEGAVYVDSFSAFMAVPGGVNTDGTGTLFSDHVHPSEAGYELLAKLWLQAIITPVTTQEADLKVPVIPRGKNYGSPGRIMGPHEE